MSDLLIKAGRIFDGAEARPLEHGYVHVADGSVQAMGPQADLANLQGGSERFERVLDLGADTTLLPGLINMHVHMSFSSGANVMGDHQRESVQTKLIRSVQNLRTALLTGVTTVRDCATLNEIAFPVRAAVESGLFAGPRVIAAGEGLTTTGGHCWFCCIEADTEDEVRHAVRAQRREGADFIKLFATGGNTTPGTNPLAAQYSTEQMCAATEEARRLGLRTASHAHGTPGVHASIAARVTTIEHCSFLTPAGMAYETDQAQIIADEGIFVCPTVFQGAGKFIQADDPAATPEQRRFLGTQQARFELVSRLASQGVRIVSGSDAGVAFNTFADYPGDLALTVEGAGLSPLDTLRSATAVAAEALGRDDLGRIAPGKAADLLAVHGNPLVNIHALQAVRMVVARGQVVRDAAA